MKNKINEIGKEVIDLQIKSLKKDFNILFSYINKLLIVQIGVY